MSAIATRTTNPLPFQDLEPKRFEDLVRQLAYDFRPWRRLEATGRSGADEGFDARALEIVNPVSEARLLDDEEDEAEADDAVLSSADRLWLIQCKRERAIGPTKAASYLGDIILPADPPLYGLVFAAACDFSKKTRDTIFGWCREKGIEEVHIWGRGELEDMLFQPKNDNLLFAYFGISVAIRRRTQSTQLRAEIATKRKLKRTIMTSSAEVLVRDPDASQYPIVEDGKEPNLWRTFVPEELSHYGLMMSLGWHCAYIDIETGEWDAADVVKNHYSQNPWRIEDPKRQRLAEEASRIWHDFPDTHRGWLKVSGFIPYRNILAIDDLGDEIFNGTHLYVPFHPTYGPFDGGGSWARLTTTSPYGRDIEPLPEKRIEKFPKMLRRV
ncbi:hypothetical protein L5B88_29235 [Pseudomonas aeruginosa]|nr:hypothetical protein [Pseudomonas aeruginosa]